MSGILFFIFASCHPLKLNFDSFPVRFNSTTFKSLPKWKESLQELSLYIDYPLQLSNIDIEGSPFKWFTQLQRLRIQGRRPPDTSTVYWTSPENTFKNLTNLKELHLNYLNIHDDISDAVLKTIADYALEMLDFAHNSILTNFISNKIGNIPTLKTIDLSHNLGSSRLYSSFNLPFLCNNSVDLITLNVNNIHWVIGKNRFGGKCPNLLSLHSVKSTIKVYSTLVIHTPQLQELYLSGITLIHFPYSHVKILRIFDTPKLKTLDLSFNQISVIDKEDAHMLMNVSYLDLRNNLLTSLSNLSHLYLGAVLLVGGNVITAVPRCFLSNNSLQIVDLHDNVFVCDCTIERLQKWMLTDEVTYLWNKFSEGDRYKCVDPRFSRGFSITEVALDCEIPLLMHISISVACGIVTIIAAYLVVRYRWHIQYRLFLLFNRRVYQNNVANNDVDDDFEDEDGVPRYDAYVIYHNQDEDWVDEQLVVNIEEDHDEPLRLCLKSRDIRAGRLIFNELSLHIRRSRKTLVILTPRFVEDNWCYFQLNMAHHRVLEENANVLIFIILEEIPDKKLTLLLRQLFCKSLCIKWPNDGYGQNLFWRRLREELKRPVPRDRINHYRLYHI